MADTPSLPDRDVYTPHDIAVVAFGADRAFQGAKQVRDYLRATYRRPAELKNTSWLLNREVADTVLQAMLGRRIDTVITADDAVSSDAE
jgi:hypothetical protein